MVQADYNQEAMGEQSIAQDVMRNVFRVKPAFEMNDKSSAIDIHDNIVVVGFGNKGFVAPYHKNFASNANSPAYEMNI